ncbi:alpha/beta hydrolase [Sphingobium sp. EM0848]|uniref:alpha/beta hydrolase n=1 Tax=Sphingobium sp. EM0848 TaxID=2743473 RepID=UPI00159C41ED|nr:alpha/beta hydrolase [Sphingobium sp. EM0848]
MTVNDPHRATAGLRGAFWDPARIPEGVQLTVHPLRTEDGNVVSGYLLARGGEETVAVIAHPREHIVANYLAAEILRTGVAVFLQAPRLVGNDIRLEHEIALYDLAAATRFLHESGFKRIISVGNSGGGPLWAFYNQQALAAPDKRIAFTPAGRPTKLAEADLVPLDGLVFVSTHLGQGKLLMSGIDPSVSDENDALSVDPSLDPFSPDNGFARNGSSYSADFVKRYREAQVARVARIDAIAREQVAERAAARKRFKAEGGRADRIRAAHTPIFPVWRTDADLRCWDLGLDPSDRRIGSLWGSDPASSNYGSIGFGRLCTAESWLSTWSGLSSNASLEACAPAIEQPTLFIEYTGDPATFPSDNEAIFGWIGTSDKQRRAFRGDHQGRPIHEGEEDNRPAVGRAIGEWLADTFAGVATV